MKDKTVLVVDDSSDNRVICTLLLESFGFAVLTAENGYEGVCRARETRPDLILMDVMMPVMDGLEAAELLKMDSETAAIPILVLTAASGPSIRRQAERCGCEALLSKPAPPADLLREIHRLLNDGGSNAPEPNRSAIRAEPRDPRPAWVVLAPRHRRSRSGGSRDCSRPRLQVSSPRSQDRRWRASS